MLKHNILATQQIMPGQKDVSFVLTTAQIVAKTSNLSLRVIDELTRQPIAKARVSISDQQTFPQPLFSGRSAGSDSKGKFAMWGVGRDRYLVQARICDKSLATKIVDTGKQTTEPFRLVLESSYPIAVDNTKVSALRSLTMLIRDSQRRLVYGRFVTGPYLYKTRLPAGN